MKVSVINEELHVLIDNYWMDDYSCGNDGDNFVSIVTDNDNIDLFFPNWKDYVDKDDVVNSLRLEDAMRFKKLVLSIDESNPNLADQLHNAGEYTITDISCIEGRTDEDGEPATLSINDDMSGAVVFDVEFTK